MTSLEPSADAQLRTLIARCREIRESEESPAINVALIDAERYLFLALSLVSDDVLGPAVAE
jgi:hypothetical protein